MIGPLRVDTLALGGSGVARCDGKAVFVPYSAPGDLALCRVVREHKRHTEAEIAQLLEPSELRRSPPCPVFGVCGGCQWQHLPYPEQVRWKERLFVEALTRQAGVDPGVFRPIVPAAAEWGYRGRLQFKCRQTRQGFVAGFYRSGSHYVVDVPVCAIAAHPLNDLFGRFKLWLAESSAPHCVPQFDLELDDEGQVRATVHVLAGPEGRKIEACLEPLAGEAGISLFLQSGRKETLSRVVGKKELYIHPLAGSALRLAYGAGGFAQVNLEQNRALVAGVLDAAGLCGGERVLDLYCGMGNFSLPLATRAGEVDGVEEYAPGIDRARANATLNGIANARFHNRSAQGVFEALAGRRGYDLVVLDPPRSGAYPVVKELVRHRPRRILYVSCDPATLARDLVPLLHGGYAVTSCTPYDLFPQTWHVESLTCLDLL